MTTVHFERDDFVLQKCNNMNFWSVWDIYKGVFVLPFLHAHSLPVRNIFFGFTINILCLCVLQGRLSL